jgi:hypothetical protein
MTDLKEQIIQTPISTFLKNHFTPNDIEHYLPLKLGNKSIPYFGGMANFTRQDFIALKENDVVKRDGKKNYTKIVDYDKADAFELNLSSIDDNICVIDVDGDNEKQLDFKTMEDGKKQEWFNNIVPEILKSCPYTLSRTKNLPHYYFILDGVDKKNFRTKVKITQDCLTFCLGDLSASFCLTYLGKTRQGCI